MAAPTAARSRADMAAETGVAAACLGGAGAPFESVVSMSERGEGNVANEGWKGTFGI